MVAEVANPAALIGAVLIASLVGSLHCAGMCGGLVLFAIDAAGKATKPLRLQLAYHGARGIAYTALGVLAGFIGEAVDVAGSLAGMQRPAAIVAGAIMIVLGAIALARGAGSRIAKIPAPAFVTRTLERAHRVAFGLPPIARAFSVGMLTPLLPCGWLYAFVIVAGGTASPLLGALVMNAFWVGTVPVLAFIGAGVRFIAAPIRDKIPTLGAVLVVALGAFTVLGRVSLPSVVPDRVGSGGIDATLASVRSLSHEDLPGCNPAARTDTGSDEAWRATPSKEEEAE